MIYHKFILVDHLFFHPSLRSVQVIYGIEDSSAFDNPQEVHDELQMEYVRSMKFSQKDDIYISRHIGFSLQKKEKEKKRSMYRCLLNIIQSATSGVSTACLLRNNHPPPDRSL